jgi:diketogulonate reductase-like aldo/keto reductase
MHGIPTKQFVDDFTLPVYGFGMWGHGGGWEIPNYDDEADAGTVTAIHHALSLGVTHFDTADKYGGGHAEELLGQAVKHYDRSKLLITTKVWNTEQSPHRMRLSLEASLQRLGMSYVDLYLLHTYPEPGVAIEDVMHTLDTFVAEGLVRHIGVSNFTPKRFDRAQACAQHRIVCNQVHYNMQWRQAEDLGIVRQCQDQGAALVAWRPLQRGMLGAEGGRILQPLEVKYRKTANQIALNWLVSQPNVTVVAKTSSPEHLEENLASFDWSLDSDDIAFIRKQYPDQQHGPDTVDLFHAGSDPA